MTALPPDPLASQGVAGFAADFKAGRVTSEAITAAYLARIDALNGRLDAYQSVARDTALATARAIDALFAAGTYLGPLMGVPIAIKDVFVIDGLPRPHVGSKIDLPSFATGEGRFVRALRRAGCVILGQTKAVEFCLGITGTSAPLGTPWNPHDLKDHRLPGGSSSGSGVAAAAGLCALAIGTDTGGSVRAPAAFNGIFGFKTTLGQWPTDGCFPLDPKLDTIGLLTKTAADAALAFTCISAQLDGLRNAPAPVEPAQIDRLRFGAPQSYFDADLCPEVAQAMGEVKATLKAAGVRFDGIDFPAVNAREAYFPFALPATLLGTLGKENFQRQKSLIDPIIATRIELAIERKASDYLALEAKRQVDIVEARQQMAGFDAVVSATTTVLAPRVSELDDPKVAMSMALGMTRNTQPANYFEWCAVSLPVPQKPGALPVGYQIMMKGADDARLLAVAMAVEKLLGRQAAPDLG